MELGLSESKITFSPTSRLALRFAVPFLNTRVFISYIFLPGGLRYAACPVSPSRSQSAQLLVFGPTTAPVQLWHRCPGYAGPGYAPKITGEMLQLPSPNELWGWWCLLTAPGKSSQEFSCSEPVIWSHMCLCVSDSSCNGPGSKWDRV